MKASAEQAERLHAFSHDLRNRLIGLQQVLDRLKEPGDDAERTELGLYGEQQYFKALREVDRLMDDLDVPHGSITPDRKTFSPAALLNERIDLLRFRFERKQQRIVTRLDEGIIVTADPRIIGDLMDALLSNASKFSHPGSDIEADLIGTPTEVELRIRDHGVGLSATDLAQVFVRFAWLNSRPTTGESQGRGTLARASGWAHAHGGSLSAESAGEGHGCTFTLRLPR